LQADLVVLQEVAGNNDLKRIARNEPLRAQCQFEELADEVWPHTAYAKNAVFAERYHGNAILSRFPILHWRNHDISVGEREPRGLLHAELQLAADRSFHLLAAHFGLLHRERMEQANALCQYVEKEIPQSAPLIIAGDFNDWRDKVVPFMMERLRLLDFFRVQGVRAPKTYPSFCPLFPLDRVFSRGFETYSARRLQGKPWTTYSDHLPLVAELRVQEGVALL
jgi:endonuclease/exonuclease/phosphatase family metal-dependent hydrolase